MVDVQCENSLQDTLYHYTDFAVVHHKTGKACDLGSKCYVSVSSKSAGAFGVLTKVGGK